MICGFCYDGYFLYGYSSAIRKSFMNGLVEVVLAGLVYGPWGKVLARGWI